MGNLYYIGKKHRKKEFRAKKFISTFLIVLFLLVLLCNFQLYPQIIALAEAQVQNRIGALVAQTVEKVLSEGNYTYDDFIRLTYNANGTVASLSTDSILMNRMRYHLAQTLLHQLQAENDLSVNIPISNIFGIMMLSGRGQNLTVGVRAAESLKAEFVSRFSECGINQTFHEVVFQMQIEIYYLLPVGTRKTTFEHDISAAQTIIVGEVPDSFTQISRLTDDVTEIEIDDAVDFGSVLD